MWKVIKKVKEDKRVPQGTAIKTIVPTSTFRENLVEEMVPELTLKK